MVMAPHEREFPVPRPPLDVVRAGHFDWKVVRGNVALTSHFTRRGAERALNRELLRRRFSQFPA